MALCLRMPIDEDVCDKHQPPKLVRSAVFLRLVDLARTIVADSNAR